MHPVDMITAVLKTKFVNASNTFEVEVFLPLNNFIYFILNFRLLKSQSFFLMSVNW